MTRWDGEIINVVGTRHSGIPNSTYRVCIDGLGGDPDQREPIVPMCGLAWEGADSSLVWCLADLAQIYCNGQGTVRGRS